MRTEYKKTALSNTEVHYIGDNIFNVLIPFDDGSNFTFLVKLKKGMVSPCTLAGRFIYKSLSQEFQSHIGKLCYVAQKTS